MRCTKLLYGICVCVYNNGDEVHVEHAHTQYATCAHLCVCACVHIVFEMRLKI